MIAPRTEHRLRWIGRAVAARVFITHWAQAAALLLAACPALAYQDALRPLPAWARAAIGLVWVLLLATALVRGALRAKRALPNARAAALLVEARAGIRHNQLINAVDFSNAARAVDVSPLTAALIARSIERGELALASRPNRVVLAPERRRSHRALAALLAAAAVTGLAWLLTGRVFSAALPRFAEPFADHPPWSPTDFSFTLRPAEPAAGDDVRVTVETAGAAPASLVFVVRSSSGAARVPASEFIRANRGTRRTFTATLTSVRTPLRVHAEGPTGRSRSIAIVPTHEPRLLDASLRITPPAYTRSGTIGRSTLNGAPRDEPLRAVVGSRFDLRATATLPMRPESASISPPIVLDVQTDRRSLTVSGSIASPGEYDLRLNPIGESGVRARDTRSVRLAVVPDEPPTVTLMQPPWSGRDLLAPAGATLRFRSRAGDDFGLSVLGLAWARLDSAGRWIGSGLVERVGPSRSPILARPGESVEFEPRLALPGLGVRPGDTLVLTLLAMDTLEAPYGQPQMARLAPIVVRLAGGAPGEDVGGRCEGWIELPGAQKAFDPGGTASANSAASPRERSGKTDSWDSGPQPSEELSKPASGSAHPDRWPSPSHPVETAKRSGAGEPGEPLIRADAPADTEGHLERPRDPIEFFGEQPDRAHASGGSSRPVSGRDPIAPDIESIRAVPEAYREAVIRYFRLLNEPRSLP